MDTTSPGDEKSKSLFKDWVRLIREAAKGDSTGPMPVFAVMESVGTRPRYTVTIGDGMGTLMKLAGAAGFLTNGCIRDLDGVRDVPLACWGAGIAPMHGELRWLDVNSPVVIDGVTIRPGDFIHADVNGAIVIPPSVIDQAYDRAQGVRQMEQDLFKKWRSPEFSIDAYLAGNEL
jgi:4-hydroxy-4-methyl-2-oxoglutarate aldolase